KVLVGGDAVTKMLTTEISTDSGPVRLTDIEAEEVKIAGRLPQAGTEKLDLTPGLSASVKTDAYSADVALAAQTGNVPAGRREIKPEYTDVLVRPVVERLASEITRSIQFYRDNVGQKVDAIYITGGTSCLPALKTHLETSPGSLPVKLIDPFAGLNFVDAATRRYAEDHKARLALAVGLALAEEPAVSLMPQYAKIMKRFATFMPSVVLALLLLIFLPFAAGGTCQAVKIQALRTTIKQYQEQAQQAGEDRRRLETLQQQFQETTTHYAALQQLVGRVPLWPGIFNALADALSGNIVLTRFDTRFDPQQVNVIILEGNVLPSAAGFDGALATLLSSLSASPFFKRVNIINAQANRTETALGSFEIQCELIY
ncbi:MAG: pilus assembly protein PilM, partial [Kiritimatiellia bacterium]|nr:pilus assembly protein PilM [Kiritimatiellia bacterium]